MKIFDRMEYWVAQISIRLCKGKPGELRSKIFFDDGKNGIRWYYRKIKR